MATDPLEQNPLAVEEEPLAGAHSNVRKPKRSVVVCSASLPLRKRELHGVRFWRLGRSTDAASRPCGQAYAAGAAGGDRHGNGWPTGCPSAVKICAATSLASLALRAAAERDVGGERAVGARVDGGVFDRLDRRGLQPHRRKMPPNTQ